MIWNVEKSFLSKFDLGTSDHFLLPVSIGIFPKQYQTLETTLGCLFVVSYKTSTNLTHKFITINSQPLNVYIYHKSVVSQSLETFTNIEK